MFGSNCLNVWWDIRRISIGESHQRISKQKERHEKRTNMFSINSSGWTNRHGWASGVNKIHVVCATVFLLFHFVFGTWSSSGTQPYTLWTSWVSLLNAYAIHTHARMRWPMAVSRSYYFFFKWKTIYFNLSKLIDILERFFFLLLLRFLGSDSVEQTKKKKKTSKIRKFFRFTIWILCSNSVSHSECKHCFIYCCAVVAGKSSRTNVEWWKYVTHL